MMFISGFSYLFLLDFSLLVLVRLLFPEVPYLFLMAADRHTTQASATMIRIERRSEAPGMIFTSSGLCHDLLQIFFLEILI